MGRTAVGAISDPRLVILDEPSSRLDPATEHLVEQAVNQLLHNRTTIIIAHRLKTVLQADDILILEHGEVREHGSRANAARDPNAYFSRLLRIGLLRAAMHQYTTLLYTQTTLLRRNMLRWLLQGPGSRALPGSPGEAVSHFGEDITTAWGFIDGLLGGGSVFLSNGLALTIMFSIHPLITGLVLLPLAGILILAHLADRPIRRYSRANREATARVTDFIGETFGAVQAVKVASAGERVIGHAVPTPPQTPRLFSDTLKNNILLGIPEEANLPAAIYTAVLEGVLTHDHCYAGKH